MHIPIEAPIAEAPVLEAPIAKALVLINLTVGIVQKRTRALDRWKRNPSGAKLPLNPSLSRQPPTFRQQRKRVPMMLQPSLAPLLLTNSLLQLRVG